MTKIRAINIKIRRKSHFRRGHFSKKRKTLESAGATVPRGANARFYKGIGDVLIKCDHPDAESLKSQDGLAPLKVISGDVRSHEDKICKSCQNIGKGCYEYLP